MQAELAYRLGYLHACGSGMDKTALRSVRPLVSLRAMFPRPKGPVASKVWDATGTALSGAFVGEALAELFSEKRRQQGMLVGATTALGAQYGTLPALKRLFPTAFAEQTLTPVQKGLGLALGGGTGLAAGIGTLYALHKLKSYLGSDSEPEEDAEK